jgi:hypothetical protein
MGMFDTLYCDYPLPDAELQREDFQTKDLYCLMDTYRITNDGRLKYEEDSVINGGRLSIAAHYIEPHGILRFYTMIQRPFEPPMWVVAGSTDEAQGSVVTTEWYEYEATFVNGIVADVIRMSNRDKGFSVEYRRGYTSMVRDSDITQQMVDAALAGDRRLVMREL